MMLVAVLRLRGGSIRLDAAIQLFILTLSILCDDLFYNHGKLRYDREGIPNAQLL